MSSENGKDVIDLEDIDEGIAEVRMPSGESVDVDLWESMLDFKEIEEQHGVGVDGGTMSKACMEEIRGYLTDRGIVTKSLRQAHRVYDQICSLSAAQKKS